LEKFIGTEVPLAAFIFTVLTTLVVSWVPQIKGIFVYWSEKRKKKEEQENMRKIMRMELIEFYYSLNIKVSYESQVEIEDFFHSQEQLERILPIVTRQQEMAKGIDFEYYKALHNIKKRILLYNQMDLQEEVEDDEQGEIKMYHQKSPDNWWKDSAKIRAFFDKIEEDISKY